MLLNAAFVLHSAGKDAVRLIHPIADFRADTLGIQKVAKDKEKQAFHNWDVC